jgi:hypothetical protein
MVCFERAASSYPKWTLSRLFERQRTAGCHCDLLRDSPAETGSLGDRTPREAAHLTPLARYPSKTRRPLISNVRRFDIAVSPQSMPQPLAVSFNPFLLAPSPTQATVRIPTRVVEATEHESRQQLSTSDQTIGDVTQFPVLQKAARDACQPIGRTTERMSRPYQSSTAGAAA